MTCTGRKLLEDEEVSNGCQKIIVMMSGLASKRKPFQAGFLSLSCSSKDLGWTPIMFPWSSPLGWRRTSIAVQTDWTYDLGSCIDS